MGAAAVPGFELAAVQGALLHYLFAMLRVGAFVISAPLFSARFVPLPVRIVFAAGLALPVALSGHLPAPEALAGLSAVRWALGELAIGVACGLVLQIVFAAAVIAGDWVAATAGLGFAAQIDPSSGAQSPVISQFFGFFLLALFVALDGHLAAIGLVIESHRLLPAGAELAAPALIEAGLAAGSAMLTLAARLMMPLVSILLIVNIVIGVMTRSAPQLNVFSFGFPLTMSATIVLLFVTAPGLAPLLEETVETAIKALAAMLEAAADG